MLRNESISLALEVASSETTAKPRLTTTSQLLEEPVLESELPARLRRHAGLYLDKKKAPELKDVLLLTAGNTGYLEMLSNWECSAKRLGLDWMVIAMNKELQQRLGERSFLATGQEWETAEAFNSKVGFKVISSNKIRTVLDVLRSSKLDIVFSDADNVFKSDPFLPSLSLGSMMRSGKYDYIYGRKIEPGGQKIQDLNPGVYHQEPIKANTGFYYVSGRKGPRIVQRIFEIAVKWCDDRPELDDQENFWDGLVATRRKKRTDKGYVGCFRHCDSNSSCTDVEESLIFDYCDMSPWEYILGCFTPASALLEPRMVSYHATHVFGWQAKKAKLKSVKLWSNCDGEVAGGTIDKGPVAVSSSTTSTSKAPISSTSTSKALSAEALALRFAQTTENSSQLDPLAVRLHRHAGLYLDKKKAPELKDVLLLTASNSGYVEMLFNWECFARRLGLDWMVIAMDNELQLRLGDRSFSSTGQEWEKAEDFFSRVGFKVIACNKIRSVLDVLKHSKLDIVFSDADNVFKSDPFLPSLSLGSMMRSGKYDYIYGRKIEPGGQKIQDLNPGVYHQEPIKANTGFYYVSGRKGPRIVQRIFEIAVKWCDDRPHLDDQENFWDGLVATRRKKRTDKGYVGCFRHCDSNSSCTDVEESLIFDYCDMSPWEYILGCFTPASALLEPRMVSYHATHIVGWQSKRHKLKTVQLWGNCGDGDLPAR